MLSIPPLSMEGIGAELQKEINITPVQQTYTGRRTAAWNEHMEGKTYAEKIGLLADSS